MTTQPEVIRQSELLNQLVLDRQKMEELGRVDVVWAYPQSHKVFGFICKSGFLGAKKSAFKLTQLEAIGENGVLTHGQPEPTDAEKVKQLESLLNREVWSDGGNRIGKIVDYVFNLKTGNITEYLFISNGWSGITGEIYQLPPRQILSLGRRRVLVAEAQTFTLYQEGIRQKIAKAGDVLKEDYTEATNSLREKLPTIAEQAKGRLQNLTDLAKERAQAISQQAKDKVQTFNEQLREETEVWVEQARQRSQTIADQLRERTETFSEQVEEGIQTLTVQAKEILDTPEDDEAPAAPRARTSSSIEDDFDDWVSLESPVSSEATNTTQKTDSHTQLESELPPLRTAGSVSAHRPVEAPSTTVEDDELWFDDWDVETPQASTNSSTSATEAIPKSSDDEDDAWLDVDIPSSPVSTTPSTKPAQSTTVEDDDDEPWI